MKNIALIRIDSRMVHGQIVTMWMKHVPTKRILVADDEAMNNELVKQMFSLAAPGVKVQVYDIDGFVEQWKKNEFADLAPNLCIFKGIPQMYEAYQKGFQIDALQIGGIASGPDRKVVTGSIAISEEEADILNQLTKDGVKITFQMIPNHRAVDWNNIKAKHFAHLS